MFYMKHKDFLYLKQRFLLGLMLMFLFVIIIIQIGCSHTKNSHNEAQLFIDSSSTYQLTYPSGWFQKIPPTSGSSLTIINNFDSHQQFDSSIPQITTSSLDNYVQSQIDILNLIPLIQVSQEDVQLNAGPAKRVYYSMNLHGTTLFYSQWYLKNNANKIVSLKFQDNQPSFEVIQSILDSFSFI